MNGCYGKHRSGKIVLLEDLKSLLDSVRSQRKIVMCHGAFDLLHIGHLHHLSSARKFGDVLVVTITADAHITKGPDRPAFGAEQRAEMLAALEIVDYVAIVDSPNALPAIEAVRPDCYVKGREYEDSGDDITGQIVAEGDLVKQLGGELVFTHDATYSSSNLLNRHFGAIDGPVLDYLAQEENRGLADRVARYLDKIADMRIVVIGETIIDRYVYVDPMGKSAKENIIATLRRDEEVFAGGGTAAAGHLSALCNNVEFITLVGDGQKGENYEGLVRSSLPQGTDVTFIRRAGGQTVRKTRFVEPTYVHKLFEVYDMDDEPLPPDTRDHLHATIAEKCADADLVVVCDFGHGMIGPETVALFENLPAFLAVNAQSNAGNIGFNLVSKYRRADFICIDALEARLATGAKHASLKELTQQIQDRIIVCPKVIVTDGKRGCYVADEVGAEVTQVPSFGNRAVDTVGAGDAFFVTAAPFAAVGANCETAGIMGNIAGAIEIGIVGHRRYLDKLEIQRYLVTLLK